MDARQVRAWPVKAMIALRIWRLFLAVCYGMATQPLPAFVARLGRPRRVTPDRLATPLRLSRAVDRTLRLGRLQPTCLARSLVLFRLLREQGDPAEVVIGLPEHARDHRAHAWVELDGRDVGPRPGRGHHQQLARFG